MPKPKHGGPIVRWKKVENEAVARQVAEDHIRIAAPITEQRVYELSLQPDRPWRSRLKGSCFPSTYKPWLIKHRPLIDRLITQLRAEGMRNAAEQPRTQAEQAALTLASPAPAPSPQAPAADLTTLPEYELEEDVDFIRVPRNATPGQLLDAIFQQQMDERLAQQAQQITAGVAAILGEAFKSIPGFNNLSRFAAPDPQRKRMVVLANANADQIESIRREFPFLEVLGLDQVERQDVLPDLVIGINLLGSDPRDKKLRKRFGRDYCPVFGGADGAKRIIHSRLVDPRLVKHHRPTVHNHH